MPDITMCLSETCPRKEDCYRYTAKADEYQAYANFDPAINCCFWSNGRKETQNGNGGTCDGTDTGADVAALEDDVK